MPPPKLSLSQWADSRRYLPGESAAEPGRWKTSRTEYAREPMDCVSDPAIPEIVIMSAAQMLKTELLLNTIGYYSDYDPCPIMMLQPTEQMAEAVSNDRITPTIRETPAMRAVFGDPKAKVSGNTILHKKFPGGHLTLAGANSPATLASRPIRVLLPDEVDRYPDSAGDEGDPLDLADQRTTTFWNRKVVMTSTPTIKGRSRIETAFDESDKRFYHIPCPRCGHFHRLVWGNVVWGPETPAEGIPGRAVFQCPGCSGFFNNAEKNTAVKLGKWVATAPFTGRAGFQISQLYAPWAKCAIGNIVEGFLKRKSNPDRLKTWFNTVLGETFEIGGDRVDEGDLAARCEPFPVDDEGRPLVPPRVLVLTAGADTQENRLEAELIGWAGGDESWSIEYRTFLGDPDIPEGQPGSPWDAFTDWLREPRRNEAGIEFRIARTAIDTGGKNTQAVYNYVKRHQRADRIVGIKGTPGLDRPIIGNPARKKSGRKGRPIDLYSVGHDAAKHTVVGRLKITDPGPGYCRFPEGREGEYFRQLTAEKYVVEYAKGRVKKARWEKTEGRRNEALDCRCYGTAALALEAPNYSRLALRMKRKLEALEKVRSVRAKPKPSAEDDGDDGEVTEAEEVVDGAAEDVDSSATVPMGRKRQSSKIPRKSARRRGGGGWMKSW
jgi:phage terminase large subunit GpA-like protein